MMFLKNLLIIWKKRNKIKEDKDIIAFALYLFDFLLNFIKFCSKIDVSINAERWLNYARNTEVVSSEYF